jgi:peptide/nickel transport system substrate-binding protein
VAGASAVFARNPRYAPRREKPDMWAGGKVPKLERIEWKIMPDPATAIAALQTGEVDWLGAPPAPTCCPPSAGRRDLQVQALDPFGFWSELRLNVSAAALRQPGAAPRPAAGHAAEPTTCRLIVGNEPSLYRDDAGFFLPGSPAASPAGMEAITAPRSVERARQLVKESGYKGETVIQMAATDLASAAAMSPVARQMMQEIGLNLDYQSLDWGSLSTRALAAGAAERGTWHAYCVAWGGLWITNPVSHLHLYGTSPNPRMEAMRDSVVLRRPRPRSSGASPSRCRPGLPGATGDPARPVLHSQRLQP